MSLTKFKITRRDFLNAALLGTGALLLDLPAPVELLAQDSLWEGFGGIGDYASSHGNTEEIVSILNRMNRGDFRSHSGQAINTEEIFDLVVVGGGLSGLGAAHYFRKHGRSGQKCLIIDNHPIFGGHAKRNEFAVDGYKTTGPQASNSFAVVNVEGSLEDEIFSDLKIPRTFSYQELSPEFGKLAFDRTSYGFMLWQDVSPSVGFYYEQGQDPLWVVDPWGKKLKKAPYSRKVRKDFLKWRNTEKRYYRRPSFERWLDTMTYQDYLENVMDLSATVPEFADPIVASALGLGSDVISAYGAYQIGMPGFKGFGRWTGTRRLDETGWQSFPGGNDGFTRYFIKTLIPGAIEGEYSFDDILNRPVNLDALDRPQNEVRMRLGASVVSVQHTPSLDKPDHVQVTYVKGGQTYRLRAKAVVMASASWTNRHVVRDLPDEYIKAFEDFHYSPVLVVNVALTNWRFLYKLGLTGCRWFEGFGFSCNMRKPMTAGSYQQPLHPDKPIVLTFYVPLHYPGLQIMKQGARGRREILSTSYGEYERKIIGQMNRVFGSAGFDPGRDIAGIILNRWVNAYINPQPGFYFGQGGRPASRDVIREPFGRIAFGHSELNGHQNWAAAVEEGQSAASRAMDFL